MERLEAAQAEQRRLRAEVAKSTAEIGGLGRVAKRRARHHHGGRGSARARAGAVDGMPGDLLKLYERVRAQHDGVGAARCVQRRCEACRLELNAADLRELAAAWPRTRCCAARSATGCWCARAESGL